VVSPIKDLTLWFLEPLIYEATDTLCKSEAVENVKEGTGTLGYECYF